jgi:hypothetical protein
MSFFFESVTETIIRRPATLHPFSCGDSLPPGEYSGRAHFMTPVEVLSTISAEEPATGLAVRSIVWFVRHGIVFPSVVHGGNTRTVRLVHGFASARRRTCALVIEACRRHGHGSPAMGWLDVVVPAAMPPLVADLWN